MNDSVSDMVISLNSVEAKPGVDDGGVHMGKFHANHEHFHWGER